MNIWRPSNKHQWVEKFKDVFINQKKDALCDIFDIDNFNLHNGVDLNSYCTHEFDEFKMKCAHFGLTMQASIVCFDLKDDFFYFALGKKEDSALFEAIFKWNDKSNLAIGNQYKFRIEPKMQFIKNLKDSLIISKRKINIKPLPTIKIKSILNTEVSENNILTVNSLEEHLGGEFYSSTYDRLNEDSKTYWDKIQVVTTSGIIKHDVMMRGIDHPLFQENLFPVLSDDLLSFSYDSRLHPVIINVLLESNEEFFFKYPSENMFLFPEKIKYICLTDTLSYDWIIKLFH